jgi:hypothetical protein
MAAAYKSLGFSALRSFEYGQPNMSASSDSGLATPENSLRNPATSGCALVMDGWDAAFSMQQPGGSWTFLRIKIEVEVFSSNQAAIGQIIIIAKTF